MTITIVRCYFSFKINGEEVGRSNKTYKNGNPYKHQTTGELLIQHLNASTFVSYPQVPSIKYITLFLANFYLPSPRSHFITHPGPPPPHTKQPPPPPPPFQTPKKKT